MAKYPRFLVALFVLFASLWAFAAEPAPRTRESFDADWRFAFGHPYDTAKDFYHATGYFSYVTKAGYGDGAAARGFDDRAWRKLDLPHDWAVEAPFAENGSHSHGYKAIGRNFPERSVGWYRKHFRVPASDLGRRLSIEFDGVYRDCVVWINGFYLGRQPSSTTGFRYDLSDYLNYGGENVIAVRADATLEEGWYYEGAGIYRHVWLTKTSPQHLAPWGTFVSSELSDNKAAITVRSSLVNEGREAASLSLDLSLLDPQGREIARFSSAAVTLAAGAKTELSHKLSVEQAQLWSLETPALHRLVSTLRSGTAVVDRTETSFGIRSLLWDPDQGFFLNGQHVLIKGTNNHQDHAGVGVAVPDALLDYRIRRLKEMGGNAYRCSHHPPAPELLDACDRLGFLVLDENRLMGPSPEQLSQLEAMILRDRNHPSVILWSLGNEEWAIEGNEQGARITASMRAFAERLDPTRRTTVAISGGWGMGSSTTTDVMGYNYFTHGSTDEQHKKFPKQPGVLTEETTAQFTRGIYFSDLALGHAAHQPEAKGDSGGNCIMGWKHVMERPFLAGLFYWTGFDYRGEPNPFRYPAHSSQYGLLDTCGFAKDSFYYLQSQWTQQPVLHLYPHWNWSGREGQPITVGCYTNHEEVELLLNGRSLGRKRVPKFERVEWSLAYVPGKLEARGYRGGQLVASTQVETTGPVTQLVLKPDRSLLLADGRDATVVTVEARDAQGRLVPTASNKASFALEGGNILGVGNGDPSCLEPDQFHPRLTTVNVEDWCGRIVKMETNSACPPALGLEPLQKIGDWKAPLPTNEEAYALSARFTLDSIPEGKLELFLPSLGVKTSLWLNGREVVRDVDSAKEGPTLVLERSQLVTGENRIQLLVTPHDGNARRLPQLSRLGVLRASSPAPVVTRSLFNGLAQVILQAPRQPGPLILRATAEGLPPAETKLEAR